MFDPNIPQAGTEIDAVQMRSQLNGLKDLIEAVPMINGAQVNNVNTLPPGSAATASVALMGSVLQFTFELPRGNDGGTGAQGPPFANAVVDAVNTLPPGSSAAVNVSFDGTNVHFTFDIPQGSDGQQGAQGIPGEVSQTDLNNGLQNTLDQCSNNSNAVAELSGSYGDPDSESLRQKVNELITALRR